MRLVRAVVMKCEGVTEVWIESGWEENGRDRIRNEPKDRIELSN